MLLQFSVSNFMSLRDEVILSMSLMIRIMSMRTYSFPLGVKEFFLWRLFMVRMPLEKAIFSKL